MYEYTLFFVKPGHIKIAGEVYSYTDAKLSGLGNFNRIKPVHLIPSREILEEHYAHVRELMESKRREGELNSFEKMICDFEREGVVASIYEGKDIISRVRFILGNTSPVKAAPGTVRGKFGTDDLEVALRECRPCYNVAHASANPEEAEKEVELWTPCLSNIF